MINDSTSLVVAWSNDGSPSEIGYIDNKKEKIGKWKYYYKSGSISAIETYANKKTIDRIYYSENGIEIEDTTCTDKNALFKGSNKKWIRYLQENLYFPNNFKFSNTENLYLIVSFTVSEEGEIEDAFISVPLHPEFDKIALKIIEKSPKWMPAMLYNRKVKSYFNQPINFALLNY